VATTVKEIEEQMEEIQMLMKIWNKFYRILTATFYDTQADVKHLDPEFQQIKQIVAEHHANFMKVIKKDLHIGQSVLTTVKRTISLEGFHNLSDLEKNKTLIEWHDANILLYETLGTLECERDKILRGRKIQMPKGSKDKTGGFLQSKRGKNVMTLVVVLVVLAVIVMYWDAISASSFYQSYVAWMLDPILETLGLISPAEVTPTDAPPAQ
jgi:hypothetical protein